MSLISPSIFSSLLGAGGTDGACSSLRFKLFRPLIKTKTARAKVIKRYLARN